MSKKFVAITAIAAIVFDLIACIGDSNPVVYRIFMGLCCTAFCVYVYGLLRIGFARNEITEARAKSIENYRKAA